MPFTTMNNYNWLFGMSGLGNDMHMPTGAESIENRSYQFMPSPILCTPNVRSNINTNYRPLMAPEMLPVSEVSMPMQAGGFTESQIAQVQWVSDRQGQISSLSLPGNSTTGKSPAISLEDSSIPGNISSQYDSRTTSQTSVPECQSSVRPQNGSNQQEPDSTLDFRPDPVTGSLSTMTVDEMSRSRILDIIVQAGAKTPDGFSITRDHPLLSRAALQHYCDLFFLRFNAMYPLLHQATFDPSQVETLLLLSVLLLGATYGDKAGHQLAVCIHDVLRAQIFQNAAFKTQPGLWMLQTILLVECFGKSRAGQTQHDMAHLFHGLLIKSVISEGVSHHLPQSITGDSNLI